MVEIKKNILIINVIYYQILLEKLSKSQDMKNKRITKYLMKINDDLNLNVVELNMNAQIPKE